VIDCSDRLGSERGITREFRKDIVASVEWYVAHIAGCLPSFAARLNVKDFREAILELGKKLYYHWDKKNFESEFIKRAIKLGNQLHREGGTDEQR
jgi:hypothetical protein